MDYREQIRNIKAVYMCGDITYEQAKEQVEALLVGMNKRGAEIAKENGMRWKKLTFSYVFR